MSATVVMTGPMLRIWIRCAAATGAWAEAENAPAARSAMERRNGTVRLDRMGHPYRCWLRCGCLCDGLGAEPAEQVIADAKRVGHDGQCRIDGGTRREKAAVDDIEVVDLVCPAVDVESGRFGIMTKTDGSVLVSDTRKRDAIPKEEVPGEQPLVAVVTVNAALGLLFHEVFELGD